MSDHTRKTLIAGRSGCAKTTFKKSIAARKSPPRGDTGRAARNGAQTADYRHQEEAVARPDVGTQPQLRKKAPPKTYRYDSSLAPALEWDGQNPARERGEERIARAQADLAPISQAEESVRLLLRRALKELVVVKDLKEAE